MKIFWLMLVYGDPRFSTSLSALQARLGRLLAPTRHDDLDAQRALLIQAGQWEQAVQDCWPNPSDPERHCADQVARLTDHAAAAFYAAWARICGEPVPRLHAPEPFLPAPALVDVTLTVKVPEGFEFYALFPEQYILSALKWAADHAGASPRHVLIVGIRSIGTTLSAVVQAALRAAGWRAERFTVRPAGDPFNREVELGWQYSPLPPLALVVDEGPGLSGSSMAAVAQALVEAGVPNISFLPGHAGEPGPAASPSVRRWWSDTPRYVTPLADLRWNGCTLAESLCRHSARLSDIAAPFEHLEDLSAGMWRARTFSNEVDWPWISPVFERMKFRCTSAAGRQVFWKFSGLGAMLGSNPPEHEGASDSIISLTRRQMVPIPLGAAHGFVAWPWIKGDRLRAKDARDPRLLAHLGCYVAHSAGPPPAAAQVEQSVARLAEMLHRNTRQVLGEAAADLTRFWAEFAAGTESVATYGDGRLAPHEWIRTSTGQVLKTDYTGHGCDHTLVGKQSVLWDLAGVIIEWDLEREASDTFLAAARDSGVCYSLKPLVFHQMAYAAFRLGLASLAANQCSEPAEQLRTARATIRYKRKLADLIQQHESTARSKGNTP